MSIQKWFDLTLLVCMLVIGTPFVIMITIEALHPITAYEPDKTAIDTEMGLTIDEVKKTVTKGLAGTSRKVKNGVKRRKKK